MIQLDIVAGFLGAGKTTFINKLISEGYGDQKTVIIENEFGDASVDSDMIETSMKVVELTSGCICCTLKGDFVKGICKIAQEENPGHILIEPTGAANLKDILEACNKACRKAPVQINSVITIVNAESIQALLEVGGDFYREQLEMANYIIMSRTQFMDQKELEECKEQIDSMELKAFVHWESWDDISALLFQTEAEVHYLALCQSQQEKAGYGSNNDTIKIRYQNEHSHKDRHLQEMVSSKFMTLMFRPEYSYSEDELSHIMCELGSPDYGFVLRGKGFLRTTCGLKRAEYVYGSHTQCAPCTYHVEPKYVIIGQCLNAEKLAALFKII